MSTEKLVAAIVDGDAQQIQQSFNQVMADKALEYIDAARQVVAQNMFNVEEEVDYLDEARADSSEKEYRDWSADDHVTESKPGKMYASDRDFHMEQAKKKRKGPHVIFKPVREDGELMYQVVKAHPEVLHSWKTLRDGSVDEPTLDDIQNDGFRIEIKK